MGGILPSAKLALPGVIYLAIFTIKIIVVVFNSFPLSLLFSVVPGVA